MSNYDFETFDELAELVDENDNLAAASGEALRNAAGWSRMTPGTLKDIEDGLKQRALGCFPALTANRHTNFRIYKKGSPAGNVVEAVLQPTANGDKLLRESGSNASHELLQKVRRMICEGGE